MDIQFFYCYNKQLFKYLHDVKGIEYVTVGINPASMKTYSQFIKTDQLNKALEEYRNTKAYRK